MSRRARDWAWGLSVTPPQKLVLLALSEHADDSGDCWPSLTRLSELTGLVRSTVVQALNALAAIDSVPAADRGGGTWTGHHRNRTRPWSDRRTGR